MTKRFVSENSLWLSGWTLAPLIIWIVIVVGLLILLGGQADLVEIHDFWTY